MLVPKRTTEAWKTGPCTWLRLAGRSGIASCLRFLTANVGQGCFARVRDRADVSRAISTSAFGATHCVCTSRRGPRCGGKLPRWTGVGDSTQPRSKAAQLSGDACAKSARTITLWNQRRLFSSSDRMGSLEPGALTEKLHRRRCQATAMQGAVNELRSAHGQG